MQADLGHCQLESLAVLGRADRFDVGPDHLDPVRFEHAFLVQRDREVEARLTADRRQQRVGPFLLDDAGERRDIERLDVRGVGELGVGHDRRRVRVDEDDAVALFAQHAARLGAGVVELAGLPDDDRATADEQDRLEVVAAGHQAERSMSSVNSRNK